MPCCQRGGCGRSPATRLAALFSPDDASSRYRTHRLSASMPTRSFVSASISEPGGLCPTPADGVSENLADDRQTTAMMAQNSFEFGPWNAPFMYLKLSRRAGVRGGAPGRHRRSAAAVALGSKAQSRIRCRGIGSRTSQSTGPHWAQRGGHATDPHRRVQDIVDLQQLPR